jgi:hypothetical protein
METSLIAKLGLNSSEFHQKIGNAEKGLKSFSGGVGNIAKVFTAGGSITAVTSFFNKIIAHARESGDALDANVQAVGRFGEAMTNARTSVMDFGVQAVGTLNRFGESIGTNIKGIASFFTGSRAEFEAAEKALAATAEGAARAAANLAEARKHAGEFNAITSALAKLEEKRGELALKNLTSQERLSHLANQIREAEARAADDSLTALDRRRALLAARTAELALVEERGKFEAEQAKKTAEWQKEINRQTEEAQKAQKARAEDLAKTTELIASHAEADRLAKIAALPPLEQQAALTREKRELEIQIAAIVTDEESRREAINRLREVDNQLAGAKLTAEQAVTSELDKQMKMQKAKADLEKKGMFGGAGLPLEWGGTGPKTYNNPAEQAAYEQSLRDSAIRETDQQIDYLTREIQRIQGSGATGGFARAAELQGQVSALRNRRNNINDYVFSPDYMDAAGLGRVGRRAADYADPGPAGRIEEQAKKQNTTLEDIQRRLARLLPRG